MAHTSRSTTRSPPDAASGGGIVVGIDGSAGSDHALAWAGELIDRFGSIRPVTVWQYPMFASPIPFAGCPPAPIEDFVSAARDHQERAMEIIPPEGRGPGTVVGGSAGPVLVAEGRSAELIVVGTRGRGAVADSLLGSVSCHVVAHSDTPVAVVPGEATPFPPAGRIMVAVDGSPNSVDALAWAASHFPDAELEAVHVWNPYRWSYPEPYLAPALSTEEEARALLAEAVAEARARAPGGATIVQRLVRGEPRPALRSLSAEADLFVVGARGLRGLAHLLLGSVASALVHSPLTPTIVVPHTADRSPEGTM